VVEVAAGGEWLSVIRDFPFRGDTFIAWGDPKQLQTARLKK
jgi:hypothetical protein